MRLGAAWLALLSMPAPAHGQYLPVVQMHGIIQWSTEPIFMERWTCAVKEALPGAYVLNVQLGWGPLQDSLEGSFSSLADQIEAFATIVRGDHHLAAGFDAIGYSQGGLVVRGYIQRHNDPPVRRFISMHGPLMGVAALPILCTTPSAHPVACRTVDQIAGGIVTQPWVQEGLTPADYFRNTLDLNTYRATNTHLADLNNERASGEFRSDYAERFSSLELLVLVKALHDTLIVPNDSQWFGYYKDGSDVDKWSMEEAPWFVYNWFGLRTLSDAGKIRFHSTPSNHIIIPDEFIEEMVRTYFK